MGSTGVRRTIYGPAKYAAFHLLLAKWIRHYAQPVDYAYVTLGGTELRDVQSLHFIDRSLAADATSYEDEPFRFRTACESTDRLKRMGVSVAVVGADIFDFQRNSDKAHLFFIDLEGTCSSGDFHLRFAEMMRKKTLREGDAIFVTSYRGRNAGWRRIFETFDAEFRLLAATTEKEKREIYKRLHPSFTLFNALLEADFETELLLKCIGCVEYHDSSPMAIYGYVLSLGTTSFLAFVRDTECFNIKTGLPAL